VRLKRRVALCYRLPQQILKRQTGVKIALALIAKRIQEIEKVDDLYVSKTNIQEFVDRLQEVT
jgi:hypothetical protein